MPPRRPLMTRLDDEGPGPSHDWLQHEAERQAQVAGRPVTVTAVVRHALVLYAALPESKRQAR